VDTVKLAGVGGVVVVGIWAFYFFAGATRCCCVSLACLLAVGGAARDRARLDGAAAWRFAVDSRMEVRKVVWPTRQETMQTTLIVMVMVLILGHVVAVRSGADGHLRFLTGQGG
jgi:preprotein translocase subunit SecE